MKYFSAFRFLRAGIFSLTFLFASSCKSRKFSDSLSSSKEPEKTIKVTENQMQEFLKREKWPRYSDYVAAFGGVPTEKYSFDEKDKYAHLNFDYKGAEQLIVTLEKAFPNGIYACLGRDVVNVCDILDVFYQTYTGEKRVRYIPGSGQSFADYKRIGFENYLDIGKKLILSNGFDPMSFAKNPKTARPYVIIDVSFWRAFDNNDINLSQSRLLLKSAFQLVTKNGGKVKEFVSKVAAFAPALYTTRSKQSILTPQFDVENFFSRMADIIGQEFDHPPEILRGDFEKFSNSGLFWHDVFQKIVENEDGSVTVPEGNPLPEFRPGLVNRMIALNNYIKSSEFKANLEDAAREWNLPHVERIVSE